MWRLFGGSVQVHATYNKVSSNYNTKLYSKMNNSWVGKIIRFVGSNVSNFHLRHYTAFEILHRRKRGFVTSWFGKSGYAYVNRGATNACLPTNGGGDKKN